MAVSTLAGFLAAVNATTGKSGSIWNAQGPDAFGNIKVFRAPSASGNLVLWGAVIYSSNPDWGVPSDINPTGAGVAIIGANSGLNDSPRYCDAQAYINLLANT